MRPFIPIRVTNPATHTSVSIMALVDTGADKCVMPENVVTRTGHNLKGNGVQIESSMGVMGSSLNCYKHTMIIEIISPDLKKIIWKSKELLINCVEHNNIPPLLGSADVLRHLNLTFNYRSEELLITI